jgi:putative membrane protein
MIERYGDHAANERTLLAWVRTAIAIMAFGFLVEKFDLFLKAAGGTLGLRIAGAGSQLVGNVVGLALIVLGGAMMVLAVIRFRKTALDIDSNESRPTVGARFDIALVTVLVLLGATLFAYLVYTLLPDNSSVRSSAIAPAGFVAPVPAGFPGFCCCRPRMFAGEGNRAISQA